MDNIQKHNICIGVCSVYTSSLKMAAEPSSETSVNLYQTTRHYISEKSSVHSQRREILKSHNILSVSKVD
jgi:hypothetical protein